VQGNHDPPGVVALGLINGKLDVMDAYTKKIAGY
jgi:hypothetical protein